MLRLLKISFCLIVYHLFTVGSTHHLFIQVLQQKLLNSNTHAIDKRKCLNIHKYLVPHILSLMQTHCTYWSSFFMQYFKSPSLLLFCLTMTANIMFGTIDDNIKDTVHACQLNCLGISNTFQFNNQTFIDSYFGNLNKQKYMFWCILTYISQMFNKEQKLI